MRWHPCSHDDVTARYGGPRTRRPTREGRRPETAGVNELYLSNLAKLGSLTRVELCPSGSVNGALQESGCLTTGNERGPSAADYPTQPHPLAHSNQQLTKAHPMREASGGTSDESARTSLNRRLAVEVGRWEGAGTTCSPLRRGGASRTCPGEQSNEGGCFGTPPTQPQNQGQQIDPDGTSKLRACAFPGLSQGCACSAATTATGHTGRNESRHTSTPSAMTSIRRSSCLEASKWRSRTRTLVATVYSASLTANPGHSKKTPARGQAATWSPEASSGLQRRHREGASDEGAEPERC